MLLSLSKTIVYMDQQRAYELANKWLKGTITDAEMAAFSEYYNSKGDDEIMLPEDFAMHETALGKRILANVKEATGMAAPVVDMPVHRHRMLPKIAVAAAIMVLVSLGAYLWLHQDRDRQLAIENKMLPAQVLPGKEGAVLTLSDGRQIALDSAGNGHVADQNGAKVMLQNKQLIYDASESSTAEMAFNTMSTPAGRQFRLTLPDGTKVWLNAASSIRYPTRFSGNERKVIITGEAYFEVKRDQSKPFRVSVSDMEVEVLGTSFNINSYANEKMLRTTLIEGAVRVKNNAAAILLKPSQQAVLLQNHIGRSLEVKDGADIQQVMAWKNGIFNFNGADLFMVLRELERWYDIEVRYEGRIVPGLFFGKMSRNVNLNVVLEWLKGSGVNYRFEKGNKLIIIP
ncbi:FecR family protein [Pseudobacter ginsenosidimutans]|uniref:FecR family protein n=2 Tax=Pseudobacter ginsenosidimutans TaxID=661488 RepID=A0A4Q7MR87_9BACT|nr:FecR family protein [Pseudobacter ginsenosidimutans]